MTLCRKVILSYSLIPFPTFNNFNNGSHMNFQYRNNNKTKDSKNVYFMVSSAGFLICIPIFFHSKVIPVANHHDTSI